MVFSLGKIFAEGWTKRWGNIFIHTILDEQNVVHLFRIFFANFQKILCTFFSTKGNEANFEIRSREVLERRNARHGWTFLIYLEVI